MSEIPMATSWCFTYLADRWRAGLGIFLCSLLLGLHTSTLAQDSRYQRILVALQTSDEALKSRFATSALLELTEVYLAEADLARKESEAAQNPAKLKAWSSAVEQYAIQLTLVAEDIELGLPVEVRLHAREVAAVSVVGRTVMLAHPRYSQQAAFEQSVLMHFCHGSICRELTAVDKAPIPIPMSPSLIVPQWTFSARGPSCSHINLQISFRDQGVLSQQKQLCQQLMQEVEMLATELGWQIRHEVAVDWETLRVKPTPMRPEHLVLLNDAGDSLLISLPLLYSTPGLLETLSPWLRQRHVSDGPPEVLLDSKALGWE
jgi:hypothetical protein